MLECSGYEAKLLADIVLAGLCSAFAESDQQWTAVQRSTEGPKSGEGCEPYA
jgi:hypothetical protein